MRVMICDSEIPMVFAFVLSMLIFRPENCVNLFNSFSAFLTDTTFININARSSANMLSLIVLLLMLMTFIFFQILFYVLRFQWLE